LKKLAVFQLNNDWGKATNDLFAKRVAELGATIVTTQAYLPDEKERTGHYAGPDYFPKD